jgi:hypothetical protein
LSKSLDALLETISRAPSAQIHPRIATHVGRMQGANVELIADELKEALDECTTAMGTENPLASTFGLWVLDNAWRTAHTKFKDKL